MTAWIKPAISGALMALAFIGLAEWAYYSETDQARVMRAYRDPATCGDAYGPKLENVLCQCTLRDRVADCSKAIKAPDVEVTRL